MGLLNKFNDKIEVIWNDLEDTLKEGDGKTISWIHKKETAIVVVTKSWIRRNLGGFILEIRISQQGRTCKCSVSENILPCRSFLLLSANLYMINPFKAIASPLLIVVFNFCSWGCFKEGTKQLSQLGMTVNTQKVIQSFFILYLCWHSLSREADIWKVPIFQNTWQPTKSNAD